MIVRPEHPGDHTAIAEVHRLAFGEDEDIPGLVDAIRASSGYVPELALVADEQNVVVGHVMFSYSSLNTTEGSLPVLQLSPLGVLPSRQRRGIGSRLVHEGLRLADGRGEPLVVVEGIPSYYPRFGFEPHERWGIERPPQSHIPEAFLVCPLSAYDPRYRGRVIYPPPFTREAPSGGSTT